MPGIQETRQLPYTAEQMFDLVADVARYPEFLPWVVATRVRSDSDTEMVADMLVGFKALREKFGDAYDRYAAREVPASTRAFSWARAWRNREHHALAGLVAGLSLLALKVWYSQGFVGK